MIEHEMVVSDGSSRLEFTPRPEADFEPISLAIPAMPKFDRLVNFAKRLDGVMKAHCGERKKCASSIRLTTKTKIDNGATPPCMSIFVEGATIRCTKQGCPLNEPPSSNDNEPFMPAPVPPSLVAHAEVEVPAY